MNKYFIDRKTCPACHNSDLKELYQCQYTKNPIRKYIDEFYTQGSQVDYKYLDEQDYILVQCARCELIFQKEIPNDEVMNILYNKWIDPLYTFSKYEMTRSTHYYELLSREVSSIIGLFNKLPSQIKILDFSAGWGNFARMAKAWGCDVFVTEFSNAKIEYAVNSGLKIIKYNELPNHKFDFINSEQVFEHLPYPDKELGLLVNSLTHTGVLKISVPNGKKIIKRLKKPDWSVRDDGSCSMGAVAPLEHINCFNKTSLINLSHMCNLKPHTNAEKFYSNVFKLDLFEFIKIKLKKSLGRIIVKNYNVTCKDTYMIFVKLDHINSE